MGALDTDLRKKLHRIKVVRTEEFKLSTPHVASRAKGYILAAEEIEEWLDAYPDGWHDLRGDAPYKAKFYRVYWLYFIGELSSGEAVPVVRMAFPCVDVGGDWIECGGPSVRANHPSARFICCKEIPHPGNDGAPERFKDGG